MVRGGSWTPKQRRKFRKTMELRRAEKGGGANGRLETAPAASIATGEPAGEYRFPPGTPGGSRGEDAVSALEALTIPDVADLLGDKALRGRLERSISTLSFLLTQHAAS